MSDSVGALSGVTVLDLTRVLAGPYCTQLLGDLGADVIKIERPGAGDDTRRFAPPFMAGPNGEDTSESAYFMSANRNKRSVEVDLTNETGQALVRELAMKADVLVENFKTGNLAKYGLGYNDLKDSNPKLVYCSITGFGQTGPYATRPGYDFLIQGMGGIMSITGEAEGEPQKVGVPIADIMSGMFAAVAVNGALRHAAVTGQGQYIDIGMLDTQVAWLVNQGMNFLHSVHPLVYWSSTWRLVLTCATWRGHDLMVFTCTVMLGRTVVDLNNRNFLHPVHPLVRWSKAWRLVLTFAS